MDHQIQAPRAIQGRWLLNEFVVRVRDKMCRLSGCVGKITIDLRLEEVKIIAIGGACLGVCSDV